MLPDAFHNAIPLSYGVIRRVLAAHFPIEIVSADFLLTLTIGITVVVEDQRKADLYVGNGLDYCRILTYINSGICTSY